MSLQIFKYFFQAKKKQFYINNDIEKHIQEMDFSLVVTGSNWKLLKEFFPELLPKIVTKGVVFARMSSDQKQQVVLELQNIGYYVGM